MQTNVQPQKRKRISRGSYIMFLLLLVIAIGSFLYSYYCLRQQEDARTPRNIIAYLIGDLRKYHQEVGRFPETLTQLQNKMWMPRRRDPVQLGEKGDSMVTNLYYYLYADATPHACAFWAAPLGDYREGTSTYYIVLLNETMDVWKGPPLDREDLTRIKGLMTERELYALGLTKQPPRDRRTSQAGSTGNGPRLPFGL